MNPPPPDLGDHHLDGPGGHRSPAKTGQKAKHPLRPKAARRLAIGYSAAAITFFAWLSHTFGLGPSILAAVIFGSPGFLVWRMASTDQPVKRREYGYLALLTLLALTGTGFLVDQWYGAGLDRLEIFEREYRSFSRHLATLPEYREVKTVFTRRKGGHLYLEGWVPSKESHDRLIRLIESMIRHNQGGYHDALYYPGKPKEQSSRARVPVDGDLLAVEGRLARDRRTRLSRT
jgi:hypothetical protein